MQVGASPADRIINHVQVKYTVLPGAELQQCLCHAAYHPLGQGNTHRRAVLFCPDGCKNREALSQCVGNTRACSRSHVPAWFSKSWFYRKFTFIVTISFYSTSAASLHLSKSSAFLWEKHVLEHQSCLLLLNTKGSGTKTLKGNKPFELWKSNLKRSRECIGRSYAWQ